MDKFLNIVVHKLQGAHKAPEIVGKMCECTFVFLRRSFIMFSKVMTYMGKESKKEWIPETNTTLYINYPPIKII